MEGADYARLAVWDGISIPLRYNLEVNANTAMTAHELDFNSTKVQFGAAPLRQEEDVSPHFNSTKVQFGGLSGNNKTGLLL